MFLHYRANGGTHTAFTLPGVTMQPHRFYLIGSSSYGGPMAADVTQSVFLAPLQPTSPGGTFYLVRGPSSFSGTTCPVSAQIIDRVGWGSGTGSCPKGGAPAFAPPLGSSVMRKPTGPCGNGREPGLADARTRDAAELRESGGAVMAKRNENGAGVARVAR